MHVQAETGIVPEVMPLFGFPPILSCFPTPLLLSPGSYSLVFPVHINPSLRVASGEPDQRHSGKHFFPDQCQCAYGL